MANIRLDTSKNCKKKTGEFVEITQTTSTGKETKTEVCKNKPSKKKGPKLITAKKICVKFITNDSAGSKKRTVEINVGLMDKETYKKKKEKIKEKILGRSGKKSVVEVDPNDIKAMARSFGPRCVDLNNPLTTPMLHMKDV